MTNLRGAASGAALLVLIACADGGDIAGPSASALSAPGRSSGAPAPAPRRVEATGRFDAVVDFSTLTLTPRGRNCLLQVGGQLVFSGTVQGTGVGRTSALVFASCADVATTPPGTYADVFRSELVFEGTVDGAPARAKVLYQGRVQPGGAITGRLIFSNGVSGRLEADAVVAVGGAYRGSVVVR